MTVKRLICFLVLLVLINTQASDLTKCAVYNGLSCDQCFLNRVLPDCEPKDGFYFDSSNQVQACGSNCQKCQDASTCQVCNEHYTLSNSQCQCSGTCDNSQLYYTAQLGNDLKSIIITFNQIIGIKSTSLPLKNQANSFMLSYDNCSILSQQTQANYGLSSKSFTYAGCKIKESQQNQFIIMLSETMDLSKLQDTPLIESSEILVFNGNGAPLFKTLSGGVTAVSTQKELEFQIRTIPHICYFQSNPIQIQTSQNDIVIPIKTLFPFMLFENNKSNIDCSIFKNDFMISVTRLECSDQTGLIIKKGSALDNSDISISLKCKYLMFETTDILVINFYNQPLQNLILNQDKWIYETNLKDVFNTNMKFSISDIPIDNNYLKYKLQSFPLLYSSSQQASFNIQCSFVLSLNIECSVTMPGSQFNQEMAIYSYIQLDYRLFASLEAHLYFYFTILLQSSFTLSVSQTQITDFDPNQTLQIQATVVDNDKITTNLNEFQFRWFCILDDDETECKDIKGNKFNYPQSQTLVINPNFLGSFKKYNFYVFASRLNNPNTQQMAQTSVQTLNTFLTVVIDLPDLLKVNYQEIIPIQYKLDSKGSSDQDVQVSYVYTVKMKYESSQQIKQYQSISEQISIIIEDFFPGLNLALQNKFTFEFLATNETYGLFFTLPTKNLQLQQSPSDCQLNLSQQSPFTFLDLSVGSCDLHGITAKYQFFYYSSLEKQMEEIKTSGVITNRKMLSADIQVTQTNVILPPGNLILMVVTIGDNNLRANFTMKANIPDNSFTQQQYEQYLESQFQLAKQYISNKKSDQIFYYQYITDAIEYQETKNPTQQPSDATLQIKNQIIQLLSDVLWQKEVSQIFLLSQQISVRIKSTKVKIDSGTLNKLVDNNVLSIQNTLQEIQSAQLNNEKRQGYQEILSSIAQDFMKNMNSINDWGETNTKKAVDQTNQIMEGISKTMITNQQPIQVYTDGAQLLVDKIDYVTYMSRYNMFNDDNQDQQASDYSGITYYFKLQTWPITHPLYRNELSDLNKQYESQVTPEQLTALQKTYPVIIPSIQAIDNKRLLQSNNESGLPFQLQIPTDDEKISCVQKDKLGKWVYNTCKTSVHIVSQRRIVLCTCSIPSPTSLLADIEQLFTNKNIQDIFSATGFQRLFHLTNWYAYAPIWTIIVLNVLFITLLIYGYKLDKRDACQNLKKQFLFYNSRSGSTINQERQNLFMQIRNTRVKIDQKVLTLKQQSESEDILNKQISLKKDETNILQTNINKKQNTEQMEKLCTIKPSSQPENQQFTNEQQIEINLKTLQSDVKSVSNSMNNKEMNSNKMLPNDFHQPDYNLAQQVNLNEQNDNSIKRNQNIITHNPNNKEQIDQSRESNNFEQINESENHQVKQIQNIEFQARQQEFCLYEEQDYSCRSSSIDQKSEKQEQPQQQETLAFLQFPQTQIQNLLNVQNEKDQLDQQEPQRDEIEEIQSNQIYQPTPQPPNKTPHIHTMSESSIQQKENIYNQQNNFQNEQLNDEEKQIQAVSQRNQFLQDQQLNTITIETKQLSSQQISNQLENEHNSNAEVTPNVNDQKQKMLKELNKEEIEKLLFLKAKEKLQMYLNQESKLNAMFAYHIFFQIFIIYNIRIPRMFRFAIYYNRLIWLLTINSVFGVKLSVVQVLVLSIVSTVIIQIVTTILTVLSQYKKLQIFGLAITSLFLLFCYYSILVVVSGQDPYDANMWIISYFSTLILSDYIYGIGISFAMYFLSKKYIDKIQDRLYLNILGSALLLQAFQE